MDIDSPMTRRVLMGSTLAALATGLPTLAAAQAVVKLILPHATGSGVDAFARAAQPALAKALAASVVVENQPGAGGVIGLQNLARSAPDGTSLSIVSNNVVILPSVLKSLPFDMPGDFTPIALLGSTPMVLVVNPQRVQVKTASAFIALLKSKPASLNYGSGGSGTILHLASELFLEAAGATATHVPYKGVGPMVADLIGGQIDFVSTALSSVHGQIKSGHLQPIGLLTPTRAEIAPDIPTLAEQGMPGFSVDAWIAMVGPKKMPAPVVNKVHEAVTLAFKDPAVLETLARQGVAVNVSTVAQAHTAFRSEAEKFAALVRKVGLQPQ